MRFTVPQEGLFESGTDLRRIYVSGYDGRVFPSRVEQHGEVIELRRMNSDSGKVHFPYPVAGFGRPLISTATLREHDDAYLLPLELARGKICQVRNQLASWEALGMTIPDTFRETHRQSHTLFAQATSEKGNLQRAAELADQAIAKACGAADMLARSYIEQRLRVRLKRTPQLPVSFGCSVNCEQTVSQHEDTFCQAFNAAAIPIAWSRVEPQEGEYDWDLCDQLVDWCSEHRLLMKAGPLLDFSTHGLPQWLEQWGHDFYNLQSFLCDFVETAISRFSGRIRFWEVSSRVNTGGAFKLNEEERLTLVAKTLEVARQRDEEAQLLIRIEDPWGTYQMSGDHRLSPMQFVDALLRCGIGLSGVNLEIAVGYQQRGGAPRDLLDFSRLIDQWSMLEVPLHLTLAFPSSADANPHCLQDLAVDRNGWRSPWSSESQADWIDSYVPMLMAKQSVVGIYWSHLTDAAAHDFPNAGLIDASGTAKAGMQSFLKHRAGETLD
ncbi:MAG: endo-1,4-beta-xylanase [Planctomycetota bacterium]